MIALIDCYTDEPSGLGVPPYLGTYPRYLYGYLKDLSEDVFYLSIDDLRLCFHFGGHVKEGHKTNIYVKNLSANSGKVKQILGGATKIFVILGVHTPGKYLSAVPGTAKEVLRYLEGYNKPKVLTGPGVYGSLLEGGRITRNDPKKGFDESFSLDFEYSKIKAYSVKGVDVLSQINDVRVIEIETSRGCARNPGCSFCTEPIKNRFMYRQEKDILDEIDGFVNKGVIDFRIGKQSCFYSFPHAKSLIEKIHTRYPELRTLHIDNVNPTKVITQKGEKITESIVHCCTAGNVAAFGVESFDENVIEKNNLNTSPEDALSAIELINKYGNRRGKNGMAKYLPGLNLLFGLDGENKATHKANMDVLLDILNKGLLLRRINVRQVDVFEGTRLYDTVKTKYIRKNKSLYWKWRNDIRQKIDYPMLKRLMPNGTEMMGVRTEVHDGNTTFARQLGTYPLIVGIRRKLPLGEFFDVRVNGHMLRSVTAELI